MRTIIQSEASECGRACLAMIASAYGLNSDIIELRQRFKISRRGASLQELLNAATAIGFTSRPLKLTLEYLGKLQLPCVLHWDLNHFVVLKKVGRKSAVIIDPAIGERRLPLPEVSQHFTGVALELTLAADFKAEVKAPRLGLSSLTGKVTGLKRSLLQILGIAAVLEFFALIAPLFQQMVVDEVLTSGDRDLLTILALGFGLLLVIQTLIGFARTWMVTALSQTVALQWTSNVFSHLIKLPVEFFEKRYLGDITSRFGAVQAIQKTLTTAVIEAVLDGLMAIAALVMMVVYAPTLALVTICAVTVYGLLRWASYAPFRNAAAERLVVAAKENTHFLETLRAITPLKLFGREGERHARWQNLLVEVQNRDVRTARMSMSFSAANALIFGLESVFVFWLGARLIMSNLSDGATSPSPSMTIGMLFAFLSYKTQFATRVSALINHVVELNMLGLHAERLSGICLEIPEKDEIPHNDLSHLAPDIELRNVSFRYGEGEPWMLKEANFRIEAGECVAVIGASGAGKTTLLKIALGLLKPTEGEVLYGGQRVEHLGLANFRRQIGTVMQEDVILTGSLAENIAFFDVQPERERVLACAHMAQLHDDIRRMPMGYETLAGDLGSGLSGGQKQRLLLARALYKQPKVLALDEATSHLDIANERAVTAAIAHMQLTRIIIAHRPETISGAQRVVQVKGGQVLEVAHALPVSAAHEAAYA